MCPTITVGSFFLDTKVPLSFLSFLFVFCSVHFFNNLANLRSASKTKKKTKQNKQNLDNTLTISPKPPPPHFFRHYATFFETFWIAPKGPPFICFDILKHNGCQKIPKGPPFYIFRHCDTVQKSHFKIFLGNFFQSLKGPPFNFFHILQPAGVSQSPKGPPFTFFDTVTLFNSFFFIFCHQLEFHKTQRVPPFTILSLRYSADFGRSRLVISRSY